MICHPCRTPHPPPAQLTPLSFPPLTLFSSKANSHTMFWILYSSTSPKPVKYSIFYFGSFIYPNSQFRNHNAFFLIFYIHSSLNPKVEISHIHLSSPAPRPPSTLRLWTFIFLDCYISVITSLPATRLTCHLSTLCIML